MVPACVMYAASCRAASLLAIAVVVYRGIVGERRGAFVQCEFRRNDWATLSSLQKQLTGLHTVHHDYCERSEDCLSTARMLHAFPRAMSFPAFLALLQVALIGRGRNVAF